MTDPEPPPWVDPAEAGSLRRRIPFRSRGLERCTMCALPPSLCICADLPTIDVATRVLLVIHHVEMKKSTNTGRLAVRILSGGAANVRGAIHGPPRTQVDGPRLVLFPDPAARPVTPADRGKVLVVPDGNWGQARRMINRDPDLLGGELVTVEPAGPSRYGLRRNPRPDALCTFEAIARALGEIEGPQVEQRLLAVLDSFLVRARIVRASGKGQTAGLPGA